LSSSELGGSGDGRFSDPLRFLWVSEEEEENQALKFSAVTGVRPYTSLRIPLFLGREGKKKKKKGEMAVLRDTTS